MNNNGIITSIILLVVVLIAGWWISNSNSRAVATLRQPIATSFIECEQYGYPVSGQNPRICRAVNGQVFTEKTLITDENSRTTSYNYHSTNPRAVAYSSSRSISYPSSPINYPTPIPNTGGCFVGGCSNQLCTDQPNAISTCEYRPEYACYSQARCERQVSGACGWTPTSGFYACVNNAGASNF